jgi:hypothetical protein
VTCPVTEANWERQLRNLDERHRDETSTPRAEEIHAHRDEAQPRIVQLSPKEMQTLLTHPQAIESEAAQASTGAPRPRRRPVRGRCRCGTGADCGTTPGLTGGARGAHV